MLMILRCQEMLNIVYNTIVRAGLPFRSLSITYSEREITLQTLCRVILYLCYQSQVKAPVLLTITKKNDK